MWVGLIEWVRWVIGVLVSEDVGSEHWSSRLVGWVRNRWVWLDWFKGSDGSSGWLSQYARMAT